MAGKKAHVHTVSHEPPEASWTDPVRFYVNTRLHGSILCCLCSPVFSTHTHTRTRTQIYSIFLCMRQNQMKNSWREISIRFSEIYGYWRSVNLFNNYKVSISTTSSKIDRGILFWRTKVYSAIHIAGEMHWAREFSLEGKIMWFFCCKGNIFLKL